MRTAIALLLGIEALVGVQGLARFVEVAAAYDATVWMMAALRAVVTVLQGTAAWTLWRAMPPGPLFARVAVVSSAVVLTLEVGAHLAPSSLPPGTRGPVIVAYWVYAALVLLLLRRLSRSR
ncbi:MAG TPA: hypothetical protein VG736_02870 [Vicinamibacterales bacterium]|nr:hypothetical protein [Vicinamibacterales bacterium]